MEITSKVARLIQELSYDRLPAEVCDRTGYLLLDYLGVALRGSLSDSSQPLYRFLEPRRMESGGVSVIGTELRVDAPYAALALGTAAHSLELDDVVNAASLHPGVSVMSAALAAGSLVDCTGPELVEAIVAGYELMVKLGIALDPAAHYARGFHPTGTCGTFGATAAAAKILKLDAETISRALGIAGSQAAGSMEFLTDGAFTKRFHAGWSAHSGLIAALLAREGFTGPTGIIEGKFGFLHSYAPAADASRVLEGWGEPWEVMHTSIKPHACCRYKQGSIDCLLALMNEHNLAASEIAGIETAILQAGAALVAAPIEFKRRPKSVVDAQFSMPYGAALAVLKGNAFLDQYCPENINDPELRELMARVECVEDPEIERDFPRKWPARVRLRLKDGTVYEKQLDHPKGDPENPLSWEELIAKFTSLSGVVLTAEAGEAVVGAMRDPGGIASVRELVAGLGKKNGV